MASVEWARPALQDLTEIEEYYFPLNPIAAERMIDRIYYAPDNHLKDNPHLGRPGQLENTREWVVNDTPYILMYRITAERIEVLRVIHHARLWPKEF